MKRKVTMAGAEPVIRSLCSQWAQQNNIPMTAESDPSFLKFYSWLESNYAIYLTFRPRVGSARDAIERWFIQEFKQGWRY
jgi:hypothetical protein